MGFLSFDKTIKIKAVKQPLILGANTMNYKNYADAYEAAQAMRSQYIENGIMVKIEPSPYGGFVLKLVPMDLMIDNLSHNNTTQSHNKVMTA